MKKIIIFGAGDYGRQAHEYFGEEMVEFFVDNNTQKTGQLYCGKKILSFDEYLKIQKDYRTVVAVRSFSAIATQLNDHGIHGYEYYSAQYKILLENIKNNSIDLLNNKRIVFFGIDDTSEVLIRDIIAYGVAEENIRYADCVENGNIGTKIMSSEIEKIEDVCNNADVIIIATSDRSYDLQVVCDYLQASYPFKVLNPFIQEKYFGTPDIVFNPYPSNQNGSNEISEEEWSNQTKKNGNIAIINHLAETLDKYKPLFNHVEIETINRCNWKCSFCPVSAGNDIRVKAVMSDELFKKIIDELSAMNYSGRLALFSNNEPFLDPKIIERHKYAREKVPAARMHLFTNGTLLTVDKFVEIMKYLDELIIDNYNQNLELNDNPQKIADFCEEHPEYKERATIVLRKENEILTSRGGDAPNRTKESIFGNDRCVLPFRQLIVRPDGKVSLCCNDPYGKMTLGDLNVSSIKDVWYGKEYSDVRKKILKGRKCLAHCVNCDTFYF
ncbi:MAG: radical SAM protein [Lachnospiraceae bacterium]|nr:radical SAM protein [Lachnospiraceae bacterium]